MSINRITAWLAAWTVTVGLAQGISAQDHSPLTPFIEPDYFTPDLQWFAPADYDGFLPGPPPSYGWFGQYDRMYIWVTRPQTEVTHDRGDWTQGDFTWGNRFDVGFMTEEDHGWFSTIWHVDGPQAIFEKVTERNNRAQDEDTLFNPPYDGNDYQTGYRSYDVRDNLNVADFASFELNKVWRKSTQHGIWLQPFFGFRYAQFTDFFRHDEYQRYDANGLPVPILPIPPVPIVIPSDAAFEQYTIFGSKFENRMVGLQMGLRAETSKNRWSFASELRIFGFQNFQTLINEFYQETTEVGTGLGDTVTTFTTRRDALWYHADEFVWGGEVRAEAAYSITRDVQIRLGAQFLDMGMGIGRGDNIDENDQSVTMMGMSIGVTLNR